MRTIIDIPDMHVKSLNQLAKKRGIPRAEIIRQALTQYLGQSSHTKKSFDDSFGLWKYKDIDGIDYQKKLRDEWK